MIDYARIKRELPKHKAALTRAKRSDDPLKVLAAVEAALDLFDEAGWPDQWATWRVALDDAFYAFVRSEDSYELAGYDADVAGRFHAAADRFV